MDLDLRKRIKGNLTPDLLLPGRGGHCYVASEAYYHLAGGAAAGLRVFFIRHEGFSHWFLRNAEGVIDLTADQFRTPVPYEKARRQAFLTSVPSKRAKILMARVSQRAFL